MEVPGKGPAPGVGEQRGTLTITRAIEGFAALYTSYELADLDLG
jgi:hypothetical protein